MTPLAPPAVAARPVLRAGGRTYAVAHVLAAARAWDLVGPLGQALGRDLAWQTYAAEEGYEPDQAALAQAAARWRYGLGLLSAQETREWLEDRGLTASDVEGHILRRLWRERFARPGQEGPGLAALPAPPLPEVEAALWPEAVLGGQWQDWCLALGRAVAVACACGEAPDPAPWPHGLTELGQGLAAWEQAQAAGPHLEREMAVRRQDLLTLELQSAVFSDPGAAREGWCCVSQDGEDLEAVAGRAGAVFERRRCLLEQVEPGLRPLLLSARPGEVLAPVAQGGGWVVRRVTAKEEPEMDNPQTREGCRRSLLARRMEELMAVHLRWEPWSAPR